MTDKKAIARYFLVDAFSTGDLAPADAWVAPDFQNHDPSTPPLPQGPEGFKQLITGYRAAFPDIRMTLDDVLVEGDKVVGRWTAQGTNTGSLNGMPPTGKKATISGISILTFVNDQVAEQRTNWDTLGMLQQLGVIPTQG
jgi:steroid delta-isomerase-like uncharacterized protein